MKVLVRIDQKSAIAQGIDAPSSTAKLEFDPKDLSPEQRERAAELFEMYTDNWTQSVTVLAPTIDELKPVLDKMIEEERQRQEHLKARDAIRERESAKIEAYAKELLQLVIARDRSLLKAGVDAVTGEDLYGRGVSIEFSGHYIQIYGESPEGTTGEPYSYASFKGVNLGGSDDLKEQSEADLKKASIDHPMLLEAFEAWQKELDAATDKARKAAEVEMGKKIKAVSDEAIDFIKRHGTASDRLRIKEVGPSVALVSRIFTEAMLKDYSGSVSGARGVRLTAQSMSRLDDAGLARYVQLRDEEMLKGDSLSLVVDEDTRGSAYGKVTRDSIAASMGLDIFVLVPLHLKTAPTPLPEKKKSARKKQLATAS